MLHRLYANWVYGGALAGFLLACLTPLLAQHWPPYVLAAWIQIPVYMLHQYEEHDGDRFRGFVNQLLAGGREALSRRAVFMINVPGVWGVIALSLYLAACVRPGLALIAVDLTLINAIAHIGGALALKRHNPGLTTAVLLFLPASLWGLAAVQAVEPSGLDQAIGYGVAFGIHAAILVHVRLRLGRLLHGGAG